MKNSYILPAICLFIGAFVTFLFFKKCEASKTEKIITRDTLYIKSHDTFHDLKTNTEKPVYVTNNYTTIISSGQRIDTQAILKDYFLTRNYIDTISNDSIEIIICDDVYKNEMKRSKLEYKWKAPERLIKETIKLYPNIFAFGLAPGYFGAKPTFGFYGNYQMKSFGIGAIYDPIQKGGYLIFSKTIK